MPADRYILDFLAPAARLVVEVDDRSHEWRRTADARRDRVPARLGYRVLRVEAESVRSNVAEVVARIQAALHGVIFPVQQCHGVVWKRV